MQQKPTDELNKILDNMKPEELDRYFAENRKYMADEKRAFYYYFRNVLDEKGIKLKDVYAFAGMSEAFGSKLVRMEKHTKDRDLILRLCIAAHFNWDETNRALKLYGFSELYAKEPRDACIITSQNNRIFEIYEIDELLAEHKLEALM